MWDWDGRNPRTEQHLKILLYTSPGMSPSVILLSFRTGMSPSKTSWLTISFPSVNAILATAFFRCWHWMVMFTGWSAIITSLHLLKICNLSIQSTLLTLSWVVRIFDPIFQETLSRITLRSRNFLPNFVLFRAIQRRSEVLVYHRVQLSYICAYCVVPCSRHCDYGWGG